MNKLTFYFSLKISVFFFFYNFLSCKIPLKNNENIKKVLRFLFFRFYFYSITASKNVSMTVIIALNMQLNIQLNNGRTDETHFWIYYVPPKKTSRNLMSFIQRFKNEGELPGIGFHFWKFRDLGYSKYYKVTLSEGLNQANLKLKYFAQKAIVLLYVSCELKHCSLEIFNQVCIKGHQSKKMLL